MSPMVRSTVVLRILVLFSFLPVPAMSQTVANLQSTCNAAGGEQQHCAASAVAARKLMGYMSALAAPGFEIPSESSTLGRRLGGMPRFSAFVRGGGLSAEIPNLLGESGTNRSSFFVPNLQFGLGLGLLDGVQLMPTVGGFLSLDIVGHTNLLLFPKEDGFSGRVSAWGIGARIGILQESFTLPGVSVSVIRRGVGDLSLGGVSQEGFSQVTIGSSITSHRVTIGKDLFALGFAAGIAWNDMSSDPSLRVTNGQGAFVPVDGLLESTKATYFIGVSKQLGVLSWMSAEFGFVPNFGSVNLLPVPENLFLAEGIVFGSLGVLLKL